MHISRPFKPASKLRSTLGLSIFLMLLFVTVSLSCSSINLFSLLETSTFTPTVIPTDTPTPTMTVTLTRTPTPSASPTPNYTSTPDGWNQYIVDEMEIWLPDGWEEWDVDIDTIYAALAEEKDEIPALAPLVEAVLNDPATLEALRIFAINIRGNGENLNITSHVLPVPVSIGQVAEELDMTYRQVEGLEYSIGTPVEIDGMTMIQIQIEVTYQTTQNGNMPIGMLQFMTIKNQSLYTLTFYAPDTNELEKLKPTFEEIAYRFRVQESE